MTEDADDQPPRQDAPAHSKPKEGEPKTLTLAEVDEAPEHPVKKARRHFKLNFKNLKNWYLSHKKLSIPGSVVILLVILAAIPFTRYAIAGTVLRQKFSVIVLEDSSKDPVTNATVSIGGVSAETDNKGKATIKSKVGSHKVTVVKKYYKDFSASVTVPLLKQKNVFTASVTATGRQVPVTILNTINGKPVENITIKIAGVVAKTDKEGNATLVVGADKPTLTGTMTGMGYNDTPITIAVENRPVSGYTFHKITPAGKIYFLSKLSGKIDVVKTNLDGTERKTVIAGTGLEEETGTVLLASRDWKYLALLSKRDADPAKLYLIETATDTMSVIDQGNATFSLSGWSDSTFVYTVTRNTIALNVAKRNALKSFDAPTKKLTTIDESDAQVALNGYFYTTFDNIYLVDGRIVYNTDVFQGTYYEIEVPSFKITINSVKADGSDRKNIKTIDAGAVTNNKFQRSYVSSSLENPKEIYYSLNVSDGPQFFELEDGNFKPAAAPVDSNKVYPTYLASPSGKSTFWFEPRDGKNTLLIGDDEAANSKTVQDLSEYSTYGWYTDDYLLVSKGGSELFILPAQAGVKETQILKVTDYHKPNYSFYGYGGGYGGL